MVAAGVIFFCGDNAALGAGINAKVAFLAEFSIYLNVTFQNQSPNQF
jgi:hypothetical protein